MRTNLYRNDLIEPLKKEGMEDFFLIFDFGKLQNITIWEVTKEKPKKHFFPEEHFV
jgi:hypothetical protein